jgi:hypothetical protein
VHKDTGFEVAVKIIKKEYVKTHKAKVARWVRRALAYFRQLH